jgi:hypothetical protein
LVHEGEGYVWGLESYVLPKEAAYDGSYKVPPVEKAREANRHMATSARAGVHT